MHRTTKPYQPVCFLYHDLDPGTGCRLPQRPVFACERKLVPLHELKIGGLDQWQISLLHPKVRFCLWSAFESLPGSRGAP